MAADKNPIVGIASLLEKAVKEKEADVKKGLLETADYLDTVFNKSNGLKVLTGTLTVTGGALAIAATAGGKKSLFQNLLFLKINVKVLQPL